ncbi:MAG: hypothetical protein RL404_1394 [Pseudomonadota bacterium]
MHSNRETARIACRPRPAPPAGNAAGKPLAVAPALVELRKLA